MRESVRHHAWILLICGLVFFVNLGGPKLWDRDEPRNAGCAVEMMERGDWVVPMFNAELRVHKPVLLYWFMMTAYSLFGVGEFAARFWSAVLGLGTVLATYHIGRRLFSAEAGLWAAIILSSCLMFPVAARAATPDSVLIFFITSAMLVYVYAAFPPRQETDSPPENAAARSTPSYFPRSWPVAALMYGFLGVAMLAKGPVGLVIPTAVIGMFLLVVRLPEPAAGCESEDPFVRWLCRLLRPFAPRHFFSVAWSMRPLTAVAVALAVALPWYVWVGVRTHGEWPRGFFLVHHLQRTLEPMEGHAGPFFYYIPAVVLSFFPWSLLLIATLECMTREIRRRLAWRPQYLFLACWAAVYIGAFSLARTKLPSYVSPTLPALALATGGFVDGWRRQGREASQYWFRFAFSGLCIVGAVLGIGVLVASPRYLPGDGWLAALGLIPVIGGLAGHRLLRKFELHKAFDVFAITAVVFAFAVFSFASVRVSRHQRYDEMIRAAHAAAPEPTLAAFGRFEPSWVFYARQPIQSLPDRKPAEAARFLRESDQHFLIVTGETQPIDRPKNA